MDPKSYLRCLHVGLNKISKECNIKIDYLYKQFDIYLVDHNHDNIHHEEKYNKTKCCALVEKDGKSNQCMRKIKYNTNDYYCQLHYNMFLKKCLINTYLPINKMKKQQQSIEKQPKQQDYQDLELDGVEEINKHEECAISNINKNNAWQHNYDDSKICTTWIEVNNKDYLLDPMTNLVYDFYNHKLVGKINQHGQIMHKSST